MFCERELPILSHGIIFCTGRVQRKSSYKQWKIAMKVELCNRNEVLMKLEYFTLVRWLPYFIPVISIDDM